jgi:hypothetical protein
MPCRWSWRKGHEYAAIYAFGGHVGAPGTQGWLHKLAAAALGGEGGCSLNASRRRFQSGSGSQVLMPACAATRQRCSSCAARVGAGERRSRPTKLQL